ncbi:MAG TPA: rhomboid family intramembrane serine protease [Bacteroidales bacterium]|nr:rhomboid family intramembrane serine protease [Bacteroidales bacterium]
MSSIPMVTKNLIIINALMWGATFVLRRFNIQLDDLIGLHYIGSDHFNLSQIITYMFMHAPLNPAHLFFNMFGVYMFGRILEQVWGPKRFLLFYMVTGIGAALMQELTWYITLHPLLEATANFATNPDMAPFLKYFPSAQGMVFSPEQAEQAKDQILNYLVTIGASGSVFGILLGFGMLFPNAPLFLMFIPIPIKAKYMVIGYGLLELFSGVANFSGDNVAHFAHLGGMLFGYFLIRYWKKKGIGNGFFLG